MEHQYPALFSELLVVFVASLVSVVVFQRLRLPDTLAYLFAGGMIGPFGLGWVADSSDIKFLSELGLVFLLFELGLEFSLPRLMSIGRSVFGLGSLQVGGTLAVLGAIAYWQAGLSWHSALVIAGALSLSSTALVVRELRHGNLTHRHHAQLAISVLIFQDLAAIIGLILVQAFGTENALPLADQILETVEKGVVLVAILLSAGKWVLPHIFREVTRTQSEEVFVLSVVVIILLSAWLTSTFGLSMALGAFLTGVMLGENEYRHQVELDIRPFKDILMGLFFVSVGMQIDFSLLGNPTAYTVLLGVVLLIVLKATVTTLASMLLGEPITTSLKTGIILAQASEFGFALLILARELGVITPDLASRILLIALGSLIVAPFMVRYSFEISQLFVRLIPGSQSPREREFSRIPPNLTDHVILAGYGRVGQMIGKLLTANGIPFIAMDTDPHLVKRARSTGASVIYGSCHRLDLLKRCHMERARLAILTFKSLEDAKRVVSEIRSRGYKCPIMVRTEHEGNYADLLAAGANHVVPEMLESSLVMSAEALLLLGFPKAAVDEQIAAERHASIVPSP